MARYVEMYDLCAPDGDSVKHTKKSTPFNDIEFGEAGHWKIETIKEFFDNFLYDLSYLDSDIHVRIFYNNGTVWDSSDNTEMPKKRNMRTAILSRRGCGKILLL